MGAVSSKIPPKFPKEAPRAPQDGPKRPQEAPKGRQKSPKRPPRKPRGPQNSHQNTLNIKNKKKSKMITLSMKINDFGVPTPPNMSPTESKRPPKITR